jgi:hypothetical protein
MDPSENTLLPSSPVTGIHSSTGRWFSGTLLKSSGSRVAGGVELDGDTVGVAGDGVGLAEVTTSVGVGEAKLVPTFAVGTGDGSL